MEGLETKQCSRCKQVLPISMFYSDKRWYCKNCDLAYNREAYKIKRQTQISNKPTRECHAEPSIKEIVFKRKKEYDEFSQIFRLRNMSKDSLVWWGERFSYHAKQLGQCAKARSLDARD